MRFTIDSYRREIAGTCIVLGLFVMTQPSLSQWLTEQVHVAQLATPGLRQEEVLRREPLSTSFIDSLWAPKDARFLDERTLLIADSRSCKIWLVENNGELTRGVGREGQGPGEFLSPTLVSVYQDGSCVWDSGIPRLSFFDKTGVFVEALTHDVAETSTYRRMCLAGWGEIAVAPNRNFKALDAFSRVILFPLDMRPPWRFSIERPESEVAVDGSPVPQSWNHVSLGKGLRGTLLVGYHNDYVVRRYSSSGEVLWESRPIDPTFKPVRSWLQTYGGGLMEKYELYNELTGLWEIEGKGFLAGTRVFAGDFEQEVIEYYSYLDVVTLQDGLTHRIPMPGGLLIRDVWIGEEYVRILAMLTGGSGSPQVAVYSASMGSLFH
jgi:hypothetical protein